MIVVAAILEKGDIIKRLGVLYKVVLVNEECVYYTAAARTGINVKNHWRLDSKNKIGVNSKEKLELLHDCDGLFCELTKDEKELIQHAYSSKIR